MNKGKIPMNSGDEYDALTGARKFYVWRPGVLKWIKRNYNKRVRRDGKREAYSGE
jgi:hypothetical protein